MWTRPPKFYNVEWHSHWSVPVCHSNVKENVSLLVFRFHQIMVHVTTVMTQQ